MKGCVNGTVFGIAKFVEDERWMDSLAQFVNCGIFSKFLPSASLTLPCTTSRVANLSQDGLVKTL